MEAAKNPAPFEILLRAILLTRRVERVKRLFPHAYSLKTSWISAEGSNFSSRTFSSAPVLLDYGPSACSLSMRRPARSILRQGGPDRINQ
jgi:hypothetical protein